MEEGNFKQGYWRRNYDLWSLVHGAERAAEEKKPKSMGSMGTDGAGSEPFFFFLPPVCNRAWQMVWRRGGKRRRGKGALFLCPGERNGEYLDSGLVGGKFLES